MAHLSLLFLQQDLQPIDRFVVEEYLLDVLLFLNGWLVDLLILVF